MQSEGYFFIIFYIFIQCKLPETAVKVRNISKVYVYAVVDTKKCSYLPNWNIMKVIYTSKIFSLGSPKCLHFIALNSPNFSKKFKGSILHYK